MLNAELITNEIRNSMEAAVESHERTVDRILIAARIEREEALADERWIRDQLIEIAQMAIEGWRRSADEDDKNFAVYSARLDAIKQRAA